MGAGANQLQHVVEERVLEQCTFYRNGNQTFKTAYTRNYNDLSHDVQYISGNF